MKLEIIIFIFLITLCYSSIQAQNSNNNQHIVDIVAEEYSFQAPSEVPSGWLTFRLSNEGKETHFVFLTLLPEGKTLDNYLEEVASLFVNALESVKSGKMTKEEARQDLIPRIPQWFYSAVRMGGPGFTEGGATNEVTLKLEPGNYFMECYLKTEEGEFHAMEGMARPLTVTEDSSGAIPPKADVNIRLTNKGIEVSEILTPGKHTIAVHFDEHPEVGSQHDIHLAKLDDQTDISEVVYWMNWMNVDGFFTPTSNSFINGTHEMPEGSTAYMEVDLEPGRYAWISQLTPHQNMVKEFTVED